MDDFSVFGTTFDLCLDSLVKVLNGCVEENLVLNWENAISWLVRVLCLGIRCRLRALRWTGQISQPLRNYPHSQVLYFSHFYGLIYHVIRPCQSCKYVP